MEAEARLFAECLWDLLDESNLNEDNDYRVGIDVFDCLTYGQIVYRLLVEERPYEAR